MTMWSGVDLLVNGVFVSSAGTNWPYMSYIKMLLSTTAAYKAEVLDALANFSMDNAPNPSITSVSNKGREARKGRSFTGKLLATYGIVPLDITSSTKMLPPNSDVEIRFHHAPDTFRIHADKEDVTYVVKVEQMELNVTRSILEASLAQRIEQQLLCGQPVVYHISRLATLGPMEVAAGQKNFKAQLSLSRRCLTLLVFTTKSTVMEKYKDNPFYLAHFRARKSKRPLMEFSFPAWSWLSATSPQMTQIQGSTH